MIILQNVVGVGFLLLTKHAFDENKKVHVDSFSRLSRYKERYRQNIESSIKRWVIIE